MKRPTINILTFMIDDDPDFIELVDLYFQEHGVNNYQLFTDPHKLLAAVNNDLAICVLDYKMPEINGVEIIKKVKKTNPNCFFIVMSGVLDEDLIAECVNAGTNKIIFKNKDGFLSTLVQFINEGIETVREQFEFYSQVWERFIETDQIFEKLLSNDTGNMAGDNK